MKKGGYVDGFVIAIPKKNTAKYKKMAREGMAVWLKFGALDYKECRIDHPRPANVTTTFAKLVKPKPNETIWFSFVTFKSRAHRDAVNKKVMKYFSEKYDEKAAGEMPFDMKRLTYAGFKVEVGK
jgi:uncharacterized protein YbaA (DUF1428 family)